MKHKTAQQESVSSLKLKYGHPRVVSAARKHNRALSRNMGFTLIEILVVIAIVAILSLVVIFTLSPAELLRQARDSNRISDMTLLKTALSLYLVDVTTPNLNGGVNAKCYGSYGPTSTDSCNVNINVGGPFIGATTYLPSVSRAVNGSGWLPVNFVAIISGAPFGTLPLDPVNTTSSYYLYIATTSPGITFKLAAEMESLKYSSSGPSDIESTDGGNSVRWYEVGTEISL
jgi:prepilin-type N-terminal cleavage/methylation domain-containing protein